MIFDVKMAWRNVWRNPRRSMLTMAAIAFATLLLVFMLSWQFGSYETMIDASVKIRTGHLQIQGAGYQEDRDIRKVVVDPSGAGNVLADISTVEAYTFRSEAFSLVSSQERTRGAMVVGIDPQREATVSSLAETIQEGEYLATRDTNQALIGQLLAKNLKATPGEELIILGQGRDGSIAATVVTVKGIFNSGQDEIDRSIVHVPLDYFQEVYTMDNSVHMVVAISKSLEAVPKIKAAVSAGLEELPNSKQLAVLNWKELNPGLVQAIKMDLMSGFIFYIILIIVVAFSILNTFLMAIFERVREFGVMLAIGIRPTRLTKLLIVESVSMTVLGIVVGLVIGAVVTWYFQVHGIVIPGVQEITRQFGLPQRMYPQLSILSISVGAGVVLAITSITAIYPAIKVRRFRPVEALAAL